MSRYDRDDADPDADTGDYLEGIDPHTSLRPDPEIIENGIPYISKSRLKTYIQCPAKYFWKYLCGERPPTNHYMVKGSRLHKTFEDFHLNLMEYVERNNERPGRFADLLPHYSNYTQWIEQIGSFIEFEEQRWLEARSVALEYGDTIQLWLPVEVEAEAWLGEPPASWVEENGEPDYVTGVPPVGKAPWMGRADLIVNTQSLIGVDGEGVTIIDYKTGSVPDKRYRHEGILTESEFYAILFEPHYDVDGIGGYYPAEDELILSDVPDESRRQLIYDSVEQMNQIPSMMTDNGPPEEFDSEPQPLCNYSGGNCHFYNICDSNW